VRAGQKITLKVVSVPKGNLFSFDVDGTKGIELKTEYDSYDDYIFTAPGDGRLSGNCYQKTDRKSSEG